MSRQDCSAAMADLRAELAAALGRSTRELTAQKTSDMSAAERGRWTKQVLAMMKILDQPAGDAKEPAKSSSAAASSTNRRKRSLESSRQPKAAPTDDEPITTEPPSVQTVETPRFRLRSLADDDESRFARELQEIKSRTLMTPSSRTPIRRDDEAIDRLMNST